MKEKYDYLGSIIGFVTSHPIKVIFASLLLSIYGGMHATNLDIETDFSNLIPEDSPSIVALEKIRNTVGGEGSDVAVGIISPSFEASKAFADDLIPRAMAMTRGGEAYLKSVEYRRETEFLSNNALYFATNEELTRMESYLEEELEEANLEANPFYFDLDEDNEESSDIDTGSEKEENLEEFEDLYKWLVGNEYPIHEDSTSMTLRFFPAGSQTNVRYIDALYKDMEELIAELDPQSYHPEMETVLAGRLMHRSIQVQAIRNDVAKTFGIGASAVLLIVILYFLYKSYYARSGGRFSFKILFQEILRLPILILIIGIPLIMSLTWTFGAAALAIGNLNLMTSTLALLLFGLGIDFGVHYYGRYSEERAAGKPIHEAAELTFKTTGKAVVVAASTTAAALFVLMIADFRGFSEFGFIAGIGIIFAVMAMLLVMPAVITVFEKFRLLNLNVDGKNVEYSGNTGKRFPAARSILAISIVAAVLALVFLPRVSFEYNFDKLDPSYPDYEAKKAIVDGSSSARRGSNPAYIVADSQEEASRIADHLKEMAENNPNTTIRNVQTLQERYPLEERNIQERLQRINEIRDLLARPFFAENTSEEVVKLKKASQTTEPVALVDVPDYLKDMFETQSGELGTFVMVYPGVELSDGRQSIAFANEVGKIELSDGEIYHASSTSIIAADMLMLMQREAPWMVGLVFIIIIAIMISYFRSFKWAMMALLPLTFGLLWMLLTMELLALKLNFFNLVVLPAIIGIANDDGIHIASRYREQGRGSIVNVLRSTGEHCVIGTLTTMVGFIGLLFSFHPGLRSIGELALIGVITTLLAAMFFLPALAQWLEDKN